MVEGGGGDGGEGGTKGSFKHAQNGCGHRISASIHHSLNQSINQSINHSLSHSCPHRACLILHAHRPGVFGQPMVTTTTTTTMPSAVSYGAPIVTQACDQGQQYYTTCSADGTSVNP